jgi:hypothetical protein
MKHLNKANKLLYEVMPAAELLNLHKLRLYAILMDDLA